MMPDLQGIRTYTIKVTYSSGQTMISEGWTLGRIQLLRMSFDQCEGSTATIEILQQEPQAEVS